MLSTHPKPLAELRPDSREHISRFVTYTMHAKNMTDCFGRVSHGLLGGAYGIVNNKIYTSI